MQLWAVQIEGDSEINREGALSVMSRFRTQALCSSYQQWLRDVSNFFSNRDDDDDDNSGGDSSDKTI